MLKRAAVVRQAVALDRCNEHADRMERSKNLSDTDDCQAPGAFSGYGLHWDLLEDMTDEVSEVFGRELAPTYDYSRIYIPGNDLKRHRDRPSCECSVTLNLRNIGSPWGFFWEDGSFVMEPGDLVAYRGCEVEHWREANPSSYVYQVFLHYVDVNGPNAGHANEYMSEKYREGRWLDF